MRDFLTKFKIPTILGLSIIILGISAGIFLVLKDQTFLSKAAPNLTAQNITVSNISDDSITISWQTSAPVSSFITYGIQNPSETALDDRDINPPVEGPKNHSMHYVTIKNLLPKTTYQYKIVSGNSSSNIQSFTTSTPLTSQIVQGPVIGSAFDEGKPLEEAAAYLSIADATTQSSLVKLGGNFLIPISQIRKSDLSEGFSVTEETVAKLTILSTKGQASALFKLGDFAKGLPPITLGENLDLTSQVEDPTKYDLNNDGGINSADNAIILQNIGPVSSKLKNPKADINADGVVDQKDLDILIKKIKEQT